MVQPRDKAFGAGVLIVVSFAVILAFWQLGSPQSQRALEADRRRIGDLQAIAARMQAYWKAKAGLPKNMDELKGIYAPAGLRLADPVTGVPYEYRVEQGSIYELCATFTAASPAGETEQGTTAFWTHPAGRHCFTIDSALVP
ncbi:MAG: hypothetical protein ACRD7E_32920 [Bryobacteraceae bacterium]